MPTNCLEPTTRQALIGMNNVFMHSHNEDASEKEEARRKKEETRSKKQALTPDFLCTRVWSKLVLR